MRMRIEAGLRRGAAIEILVDGAPLACHAGETVAAALIAGGVRAFRASPRSGAPRAPFCFMGVCHECLVTVAGRQVTSCTEVVRPGLVVSLGIARGNAEDGPTGDGTP